MKFNKTITFSLIGVAVAAFVLGALLFGGNGGRGSDADVQQGHEHTAASEEAAVWTCSMHPQIKLPQKRQMPDLLHGSDPARDRTPVTNSVRARSGCRTRQNSWHGSKRHRRHALSPKPKFGWSARSTHDESRLAYITAWVPGRIDRLYADYTGMTVGKGDHMVLLYSPELLATQEELIQAKAAVEALNKTTSNILRSTADATVDATREKLRFSDSPPSKSKRSRRRARPATIDRVCPDRRSGHSQRCKRGHVRVDGNTHLYNRRSVKIMGDVRSIRIRSALAPFRPAAGVRVTVAFPARSSRRRSALSIR